MSEYSLKLAVGSFLVVGHFALLVLIIILYLMHGFAFSEMTTTIGLIGPLFAGYTSVIFAFIIKHKNETTAAATMVNMAYAVASFAMPALFVAVLFVVVICKAANVGFADFENFKIMIGIIEAAFGVYVGQFVYSMFEAVKKDQDNAAVTGVPGS